MLGPLGSALQDKRSPEEKGKVEILRCIWGQFRMEPETQGSSCPWLSSQASGSEGPGEGAEDHRCQSHLGLTEMGPSGTCDFRELGGEF